MTFTPKLIALDPLREVPAAFSSADGEQWYRLKDFPDYAVSTHGSCGRLTVGRRGVQPGLLVPHLRFWKGLGMVSYRLYSNGKRKEQNLASLLHSIRSLKETATKTDWFDAFPGTSLPCLCEELEKARKTFRKEDGDTIVVRGCPNGSHTVRATENTAQCEECGDLDWRSYYDWARGVRPAVMGT